jgi:hypothetical protein
MMMKIMAMMMMITLRMDPDEPSKKRGFDVLEDWPPVTL